MHDLERQLGLLESTQLVRRLNETDLAYIFKHVLAQETTYQSMLVKTRREIHLRVAQYYERQDAQMPDASAAILAHHYFEAGDLAKTFHYAVLAGDAAARLYAHSEALMFYDRALGIVHRFAGTAGAQLLPEVEVSGLYTNRGRVYELTNRYDLAVENYIEMETMGRAQPNPGLELAGMTQRAILYSTYTSEFDPIKANELNARILDRARELGDRAAEAKVLWIMLLLNKYSEGNLTSAIEHGEQSLMLARELGLREQMAYTLNDLAFPYSITGNLRKGNDALREAIELWQELGNLAMLSDTWANYIPLHFYLGDMEGAKRASAEAMRLSQMTGSLWGQTYSLMWIGPVHAEQGDYGTALALIQECLRRADTAGFLPPQVSTRADLAWLLGELGQLEQAIQQAERAEELLQAGLPFGIFVESVRIRLALLAGDIDGAERLANQESFRGDSPFKRDPDGMTRVALAEAELALAKMDYARGLAAIEPALEFLMELAVVPFVPELLYLKARILYAQGDVEGARANLMDALRRAQAADLRRMQWQILGLTSEIETLRGNPERAGEYRAQARETVMYISGHIGSQSLEQSFLALPRVQALFAPA